MHNRQSESDIIYLEIKTFPRIASEQRPEIRTTEEHSISIKYGRQTVGLTVSHTFMIHVVKQ